MRPTEGEIPGLHPLPPLDLADRQLPTVTVELGMAFYRVHQAQYSPIYFGRSGRSRFDAPEKEYGVLYMAQDEFCAFRETIGRFSRYRLISQEVLQQRCLSEIRADSPLTLVDLTGAGLTHLDADGRLFTGDYKRAQAWGLAFYHHPAQPDGIYYRSRHDPSRFCLALYERTKPNLELVGTHSFFAPDYVLRLATILDCYQYGLV